MQEFIKNRQGMRLNDEGFTLIELLIAFAILSVSLTVLLGVFSSNLRRAEDSEMQAAAASHIQSLIAQAGIEQPLKASELSGVFADGQHWQLRIEPYGNSSVESIPHAFAITATISWGDDKTQPYRLSLSTLKLAGQAQ